MCDLSEGVYNDGREKGREEGLVESIRRMMAKLKLSAEKAMEILDIPEEERPKYREKLYNRSEKPHTHDGDVYPEGGKNV